MQVVTYFYKLVPNQILPNKIYEMHEYDMQTNIKIGYGRTVLQKVELLALTQPIHNFLSFTLISIICILL